MSNRLSKLVAFFIGCALICSLIHAQDTGAGLLKPGDKIPGAFQTLAVTLPPSTLKPIAQAGRYHCPVCEFGLNPGILVFAKQPDSAEDAGKTASVTGLLKKLDAVIAKHPDALAGASATFGDGGYLKQLLAELDDTTGVSTPVKDVDFTKAIEFKEKAEARLKELAKAAEFKHVGVSLGLPETYPIPANNDARILFYYKHEVIFDEAFAHDKLTDAAIEKIVKTVGEKLAAVEKENQGQRQ